MSPFDFVKQILQGKKQLIVDDVTEKEYVPFLVNRSLSYHKDCVLFANEINQRHFIDKKMQNDFLLNTVRSQRRTFAKWLKPEKRENVDYIKILYNMSEAKAQEALRILPKEQLKELKGMKTVGDDEERPVFIKDEDNDDYKTYMAMKPYALITLPTAILYGEIDKANLHEGSRKDEKDIGVIAQETEKVLPEIVREKKMGLHTDSDEKFKTVDYDKLTAVLIESIKEQQKQIEELKSEIQELKDGSSK